MSVYYKEEIPDVLHYRKDANIAPIVAICNEGYILDRAKKTYKAVNGYDNTLRSMRAIFMGIFEIYFSFIQVLILFNVI